MMDVTMDISISEEYHRLNNSECYSKFDIFILILRLGKYSCGLLCDIQIQYTGNNNDIAYVKGGY